MKEDTKYYYYFRNIFEYQPEEKIKQASTSNNGQFQCPQDEFYPVEIGRAGDSLHI